ncbi:hypothetical protein CHS0354_027363 [Potamilus streckersoni]|uniref:GTPase Der n=1 Tax=Potamilus streckersoni TaxID=2493646 RepID=A0AAE0SR83_9BIVA|nr:hypothetical protein CHS0354_027363 [Potamilus streckersoni]
MIIYAPDARLKFSCRTIPNGGAGLYGIFCLPVCFHRPLKNSLPVVGLIISIVGRPNTGKSTLFNALTGTSRALTDDMPGVTRDTVIGMVEDGDFWFTLCDTAGLSAHAAKMPEDTLEYKVNRQAEIAAETADGIIFLTDRKSGFLPEDADIYRQLRRSGKKLYFCVNKVDDAAHELSTAEFFEAGTEDILTLSAAHRKGLDELIAAIRRDFFKGQAPASDTIADLSLAVIGRPNTGKSTLVNRLLGYEKQITHDMAGTTRDAVDSYFKYYGKTVRIIDTAGIRRKSRVDTLLEKVSVLTAIRSVSRADVVILMTDTENMAVDQDMKLAAYVRKAGKPMIIAVNKWDICEKDSHTAERMRKDIKERMVFAAYCPVLFISAREGQRVPELLQKCFDVQEKSGIKIPTARLIKVLKEASEANPIHLPGGRKDRVMYASQLPGRPPAFMLRVKRPDMVMDSYTAYMENTLRKHFDLEALPIRILWKAKEKS